MVFRKKGMDGLHATAIAAVTSALVFLPIYVVFLNKGIGETPWRDIALQGFYQGVLTSAFGVFAFNRAVVLWERQQGRPYPPSYRLQLWCWACFCSEKYRAGPTPPLPF